jgi:CRISPR-associated endonuclease/helicase Cas3
MSFADFFQAATVNMPYEFQCRLACGERADGEHEAAWLNHGTKRTSKLINVPTGLGKTAAVVLARLWNRVAPSLNTQPSTINSPTWLRRLVYCLSMRTLAVSGLPANINL